MSFARAKVILNLKFIQITVVFDNFSYYIIYLIKIFGLKLFKINLNIVLETLILSI